MANSWSGLRHQLENKFLCEKLRGRIQYFLTHYHGAPDKYGRIAIRVDGKEVLFGNPYSYYVKGYSAMERHIKCENDVPSREWTPKAMLYDDENSKIEDAVKNIAVCDGVFEIYDITDAIRIYTQAPIDISLQHENPVVRLFAILDYRVGKRSLLKLIDTIEEQPEWLKIFYRLRLDAENINPPQSQKI